MRCELVRLTVCFDYNTQFLKKQLIWADATIRRQKGCRPSSFDDGAAAPNHDYSFIFRHCR